jgi:hypothetical protein
MVFGVILGRFRMKSDDFVLTAHSIKQQRAILSEKRILVLGTGTQWGKTIVGAARMKLKIHTYTAKDDNFLITSPTYKTMQQSTLPAFLKIMQGCGTYHKQDGEFKVSGGGTVYLRTETDPDSIVGITNIRHIWGDEAGKYRLYFWENMQARADFCGSGIDLTTSPYSLNWIPKELIKPYERGHRPDVEYIQAASWENPYHSLHIQEARDHKQKTMDPRRFDMIYGGQFGKMAGLVYNCFDEELHVVKPFPLPHGTRYYGGIDWGHTDPFSLGVRAITPSGHHFCISEFYKTGMTPTEIFDSVTRTRDVFGVTTFYADPSRPDMIKELNHRGVSCVPADNSIGLGVGIHYDLIKSGKYQVFQGTSPHLLDEYSTYHYPEPEDLGPDDDSKEVLPVGQNDHCLDRERYITVMTHRSSEKHTPKTPDEKKQTSHIRNHEKRIAALKRGNKNMRGTEDW